MAAKPVVLVATVEYSSEYSSFGPWSTALHNPVGLMDLTMTPISDKHGRRVESEVELLLDWKRVYRSRTHVLSKHLRWVRIELLWIKLVDLCDWVPSRPEDTNVLTLNRSTEVDSIANKLNDYWVWVPSRLEDTNVLTLYRSTEVDLRTI